jgi:hypothetical protein
MLTNLRFQHHPNREKGVWVPSACTERLIDWSGFHSHLVLQSLSITYRCPVNMDILPPKMLALQMSPKKQNGDSLWNVSHDLDKVWIIHGDRHPEQNCIDCIVRKLRYAQQIHTCFSLYDQPPAVVYWTTIDNVSMVSRIWEYVCIVFSPVFCSFRCGDENPVVLGLSAGLLYKTLTRR